MSTVTNKIVSRLEEWPGLLTYNKPAYAFLKEHGYIVYGEYDTPPNLTKNGQPFYIGSKAVPGGGIEVGVVAFMPHAEDIELFDNSQFIFSKDDLMEMSASAKEMRAKKITLYTNFGMELHSQYDKPEAVGFDNIVKVIRPMDSFKSGGTMAPGDKVIKITPYQYNGWHYKKQLVWVDSSNKSPDPMGKMIWGYGEIDDPVSDFKGFFEKAGKTVEMHYTPARYESHSQEVSRKIEMIRGYVYAKDQNKMEAGGTVKNEKNKVKISDLVVGENYINPNTGDVVKIAKIDKSGQYSKDPIAIDTDNKLHATDFLFKMATGGTVKKVRIPKEERVTIMIAIGLLGNYSRTFNEYQVGYTEQQQIINNLAQNPKSIHDLNMAILYLGLYKETKNDKPKEKSLIERIIGELTAMVEKYKKEAGYKQGGNIPADSLQVGDEIGYQNPRNGRYKFVAITKVLPEENSYELTEQILVARNHYVPNVYKETFERVKTFTNEIDKEGFGKPLMVIRRKNKFEQGGSVDQYDKQKVKEIAAKFSEILWSPDWVGPEDMPKVIAENKSNNDDTCATHDYVDANMAMDEAFTAAMGREYTFFNDEEPETEKQNEIDTWYFNEAWDLAKENDFDVERINAADPATFARGGKVNAGISRDRKFRSQEPHEQNYQRKTTPTNPHYMATGGTVKGQNMDIYGYRTQNFDMCAGISDGFKKAIANIDLEHDDESAFYKKMQEYLKAFAIEVDEILHLEKIARYEGYKLTEQDFTDLLNHMSQASVYNYKSGNHINVSEIIGPHIASLTELKNKAADQTYAFKDDDFYPENEMFAKGGNIPDIKIGDTVTINSKRFVHDSQYWADTPAITKFYVSVYQHMNDTGKVMSVTFGTANVQFSRGSEIKIPKSLLQKLELDKKEDGGTLYDVTYEKIDENGKPGDSAYKYEGFGPDENTVREQFKKEFPTRNLLTIMPSYKGYKKGGTIDTDTPIIPEIIADSVANDVIRSMHPNPTAEQMKEAPAKMVALSNHLVKKTNDLYKNSPFFKKKMNASGNKGRDALYTFMYHWSEAYNKKNKFESGGTLSEDEMHMLNKKGFTIEEFKEFLNSKFPDSFRFQLYELQEGTRDAQLIPDFQKEVKDNKLKLFFPKRRQSRELIYKVFQGGENTYFYFILETETDQYIGNFGFKDEGSVSPEYITRFTAFLMEAYGYPFQSKNIVFEKGGELSDYTIVAKPGYKYQNILKRWLEDTDKSSMTYKLAVLLLQDAKNPDELLGIDTDSQKGYNQYAALLRHLVKAIPYNDHSGAFMTENYNLSDAEQWAKESLKEGFTLKGNFKEGGSVSGNTLQGGFDNFKPSQKMATGGVIASFGGTYQNPYEITITKDPQETKYLIEVNQVISGYGLVTGKTADNLGDATEIYNGFVTEYGMRGNVMAKLNSMKNGGNVNNTLQGYLDNIRLPKITALGISRQESDYISAKKVIENSPALSAHWKKCIIKSVDGFLSRSFDIPSTIEFVKKNIASKPQLWEQLQKDRDLIIDPNNMQPKVIDWLTKLLVSGIYGEFELDNSSWNKYLPENMKQEIRQISTDRGKSKFAAMLSNKGYHKDGGQVNEPGVAETIRDQIGNKAFYMLGAYNLVKDTKENWLSFRIRGSKKANYIKVTLMPDDTYTMEFGIIRQPKNAFNLTPDQYFAKMYKITNTVPGVYAEDLNRTIEENTNLYTKLFEQGGSVNDQYKELYYVQDAAGKVKNISTKPEDADNFLAKQLKYAGNVYVAIVLQKDWDAEKINTSNIKNYNKASYESGGQVNYGTDGLLHALLQFVSSGTIANKTGLSKYKDIDGVRHAAIQMLIRDGDREYSLANLEKLLGEAKDEWAENKSEYEFSKSEYKDGGKVNTHSDIDKKVIDYLKARNFNYTINHDSNEMSITGIKVDDRRFDISNSIAIEKLGPGIMTSSASYSKVWFIFISPKLVKKHETGGEVMSIALSNAKERLGGEDYDEVLDAAKKYAGPFWDTLTEIEKQVIIEETKQHWFDGQTFAKGGNLYDTDEKKLSFLKKKGNIVSFKEHFAATNFKAPWFTEPPVKKIRAQIGVDSFEKHNDGRVRISGNAYNTPWFASEKDIINAIDWDVMEGWHKKDYETGGKLSESAKKIIQPEWEKMQLFFEMTDNKVPQPVQNLVIDMIENKIYKKTVTINNDVKFLNDAKPAIDKGYLIVTKSSEGDKSYHIKLGKASAGYVKYARGGEMSAYSYLGGETPLSDSAMRKNVVEPNLGMEYDVYKQFTSPEYQKLKDKYKEQIKSWKNIYRSSSNQGSAEISKDQNVIYAAILENAGIIGVFYVKKIAYETGGQLPSQKIMKQRILAFTKQFPLDAKDWGQATGELPDLHYTMADEYESGSGKKYNFDFEKASKTPAELNKRHREGIETLLKAMNDEEVKTVYLHYEHWFDKTKEFAAGGQVKADWIESKRFPGQYTNGPDDGEKALFTKEETGLMEDGWVIENEFRASRTDKAKMEGYQKEMKFPTKITLSDNEFGGNWRLWKKGPGAVKKETGGKTVSSAVSKARAAITKPKKKRTGSKK